MTPSSKAAERYTLILELGQLLYPVRQLADRDTPPTPHDYQVVAAKFAADLQAWIVHVHAFTLVGGVRFDPAQKRICQGPDTLGHWLAGQGDDYSSDPAAVQSNLRGELGRRSSETIQAIDRVPIDWESRLLEERTPFTAYLLIRDAIATAQTRVHYFDRYLRPDFFDLYLRGLDRSLQIRLITTTGKTDYGVTAVRAVSRLASKEFNDYQLIECVPATLHDRNLRVDDRIFSLGPSIDDAGRYPTNFTLGDSSSSAHAILDGIASQGIVVA